MDILRPIKERGGVVLKGGSRGAGGKRCVIKTLG